MRAGQFRYVGVLAAALAGSAIALVAGQQPAGAPVYTAAQATAGRAAYQANCASCHVADLGGRNEAPQLAGGDFMNTWRTRTVKDLFDYMSSTMPPGGPSLSPDQYASIVAYILQQNSAQRARPRSTAAQRRRSAASPQGSSRQPRSLPPRAVGRRVPAAGRGRALAATDLPLADVVPAASRVPQPRGVTVAGEVKNCVPVTDEMLKNPPAATSLMARRTYSGQSYSPLSRMRGEREGPEARVGPEHERGRRQPDDAPGAQRDHVSLEHRQRDPGARREDR
ncbi:MAG: cytochrome c [Vicinamibacterales bacterium]